MNEKRAEEDSIRLELEKQTEEEVVEWAALVDKYQGELNRFKMVCCYCGTLLDPDILNLPCKLNCDPERIGTLFYRL